MHIWESHKVSIIHWQVNAFKWLFPFVLSILLLSGCGTNSQFINPFNLDAERVESSALPPELTPPAVAAPEVAAKIAPVIAPVIAPTIAPIIEPSPEAQESPAPEAIDLATSPPEDPSELEIPQQEDSSELETVETSVLTELLVGEQLEQ
jgi:hypothetical protein